MPRDVAVELARRVVTAPPSGEKARAAAGITGLVIAMRAGMRRMRVPRVQRKRAFDQWNALGKRAGLDPRPAEIGEKPPILAPVGGKAFQQGALRLMMVAPPAKAEQAVDAESQRKGKGIADIRQSAPRPAPGPPPRRRRWQARSPRCGPARAATGAVRARGLRRSLRPPRAGMPQADGAAPGRHGPARNRDRWRAPAPAARRLRHWPTAGDRPPRHNGRRPRPNGWSTADRNGQSTASSSSPGTGPAPLSCPPHPGSTGKAGGNAAARTPSAAQGRSISAG